MTDIGFGALEDVDTPLTSRAQVKARAKDAGSAEKRRRSALYGLLTLKEGRELMHWLLEKCHIDKSSTCLNASGFDAYGTFFNEGARSVGLALYGEIVAAHPEGYALMEQEARERAEIRKGKTDAN